MWENKMRLEYKNMDLNRLFVLNMKKWRKIRGLSQKTVAERCEAAHVYIRQIENGSRAPSFAFIGKIANALGIEAYQLFYDETAEQDKNPSQKEYIEVLKTNFIEKMAIEIDTVISELQKSPTLP
jgi:transcriptional regulator with XRE-family HTH domain